VIHSNERQPLFPPKQKIPQDKPTKTPDPTVTALKNAHLPGNGGAKNHQNIGRRRGMLAKALRGNKDALPVQPDPTDSGPN
jgi:hypothetical protein